MAVAQRDQKAKDISYAWEGKDKTGKTVKGEMRAPGEASVSAYLRRQGINVTKIKKLRRRGKSITAKDITLFTRQLAVMMKSGVPLLQAFDIVGKGHSNPSVSRLLLDIKTDVETGSSLQQAFLKFPLYFDALYCNLIGAGEAAGILDALLERLATYMEKTQALKEQNQISFVLPDFDHRGGVPDHRRHHDFRDPGIQGTVRRIRRTTAGADPGADGHFRCIRKILVGDFRRDRRRLLHLLLFLETQQENAGRDGQTGAQTAHLRRADPQGHDRALDAHAGHHVCGGRAAGRIAGFGCRCGGQRGVLQRHQRSSSAKSAPAAA